MRTPESYYQEWLDAPAQLDDGIAFSAVIRLAVREAVEGERVHSGRVTGNGTSFSVGYEEE